MEDDLPLVHAYPAAPRGPIRFAMSNDPASGSARPRPAAPANDTRFTPHSDASPAGEGGAEASRPGAFLPCSDCRTPMRSYYYCLETRPLCPKCKVPYAAQIARGSGPGSMTRVLLYGGGAALGCAILLGLGVLAFGYLRAIAAIGVGYAVGRAVNHASGSFYDVRFRVIAAVFTYIALGLGSLAPVFKAIATVPDSAVEAAMADADGAAAVSGDEDEDEVSVADDPYAGMTLDEIATQMEEDREERKQAALDGTLREKDDEAAAAELKAKGFFSMLGTIVVLFFTLPLLANFAYGLYAGGFGALAMGYGVYKAWTLTGNTVGVLLSGPHRIGTGPVPQTHGS